ncbi:MAG: hypothetical protein HYX43_19275 [Burkholderiales bacterium]|nr:hypothetical protein [Burkholderiales bacterium]
MKLRIFLLATLIPLMGQAETCPKEVAQGIDDSGTDYYNASRAVCLPKEQEALKRAVFALATTAPHQAWLVMNALLCRKSAEARRLIDLSIANPLKETLSVAGEKDAVSWHNRRSVELMERGCAFSPTAVRVSASSIKLSYSPYMTTAYCGRDYILQHRNGGWYIAEKHDGCD